MSIGGKDFYKDVGEVVVRSHKGKTNHFPDNLFTETDHLNTEVVITTCDDVVVNHRHTGLVVLEQLGGIIHVET